MKVSILIPSYNDSHILSRSLPVLLKNLPRNFESEIVLINDAPDFDLKKWVAQNFSKSGIKVITMPYNSGFAATLNKGFQSTSGDFVFFYNSDLFIEPRYIESMVHLLEVQPKTACVTGKILRYDLKENQKLDKIDTTGFLLFKNRRVIDRGEGEVDSGQYNQKQQVFGISGCAWFGRRKALDDVAIDGRVFDENFFMYKEDVELAWRLLSRGWEAWYQPAGLAFHGRTSSGIGQQGYLSAISSFSQNERTKSNYVRIHSMKNQWLILLMHETWYGWLKDGWRILGRELIVLGYNALFSPSTLRAAWLFVKVKLSALKKRRVIQSRRTVPAREVLKWAR